MSSTITGFFLFLNAVFLAYLTLAVRFAAHDYQFISSFLKISFFHVIFPRNHLVSHASPLEQPSVKGREGVSGASKGMKPGFIITLCVYVFPFNVRNNILFVKMLNHESKGANIHGISNMLIQRHGMTKLFPVYLCFSVKKKYSHLRTKNPDLASNLAIEKDSTILHFPL